MSLILDGSNGLSDVDGTAATPAIRGTDTNTGIFFPAADTIAFSEGGTEAMRIDGSGNLGIGTTSPLAKLHLQDNAAVYIQMTDVSDGASRIGQNGTSLTFGVDGVNGSTERMRINSSGDVLVAKNTTVDTTVGCSLFGIGRVTSTMASGTGAQSTLHVYSTDAAAYRFYVSMAGVVNATNTTISAISDQRLKENIQDIDVGLDAIMALKPRKFDWKAGKGKGIKGDRGWVAQEFEQVFPEMINDWLDPAPEGEEPYKSVAADLIPVLVKAIQELKATVDAQAARIAALESAKA